MLLNEKICMAPRQTRRDRRDQSNQYYCFSTPVELQNNTTLFCMEKDDTTVFGGNILSFTMMLLDHGQVQGQMGRGVILTGVASWSVVEVLK